MLLLDNRASQGTGARERNFWLFCLRSQHLEKTNSLSHFHCVLLYLVDKRKQMLDWEPGIVVQTCNPSTWRTEARNHKFKKELDREDWAFCGGAFILFRNVLGHKPLLKPQCIFKMCTLELKSWLSEWEHCVQREKQFNPQYPWHSHLCTCRPSGVTGKGLPGLAGYRSAGGPVRDAVSVECGGKG